MISSSLKSDIDYPKLVMKLITGSFIKDWETISAKVGRSSGSFRSMFVTNYDNDLSVPLGSGLKGWLMISDVTSSGVSARNGGSKANNSYSTHPSDLSL